MTKKYKTVAVEDKTLGFLSDCEYIYRKHHPELKDIVLTKSKILNEVMRFYLDKTERSIPNED